MCIPTKRGHRNVWPRLSPARFPVPGGCNPRAIATRDCARGARDRFRGRLSEPNASDRLLQWSTVQERQMSLNPARRQSIDIAIAAGTQPNIGRSAQTTLRLRQNPGRSSYALLSRADGTLTPAGDHYFASTGTPEPSRQFDRGAPLTKKGAGDYVTTRSGRLALVRKLQPDGTTHVTRLGRQYFRGGRTEYVVSVPVIVSGKNARGRIQNRRTLLPVDMLGIGRLMQDSSIAEGTRVARVKSHVLKTLAIRSQGGGYSSDGGEW